MTSITQDADDFGGQRFVEDFDDSFAIGFVSFSHCAFLDVPARAFAQSFDVGQKRFIRHGCNSLVCNLFRGRMMLLAADEQGKLRYQKPDR